MRSVRAAGFRGRSRIPRSLSFATVRQFLQCRLRLAASRLACALQQSGVTPFRPSYGGFHCYRIGLGNARDQTLAKLSTNATWLAVRARAGRSPG